MSVPAERAPAPASWKETARTLWRATAFSFWSGIVVWRWLVLLPVFGVSAVLIRDILRFSFETDHISRRVDVWDLFPGMVSHAYMVLFLFGGGFMLLVGDSFKREQEQGAVAMAMVRMPSRWLYWLAAPQITRSTSASPRSNRPRFARKWRTNARCSPC